MLAPLHGAVRTWKLIVEYDGTAYQGWQVQATGPTVQGVLEERLARLTGESIRVTAAGRTDSGVHAWGQVVSFRTASRHEGDVIQRALNATLPDDICVRDVVPVAADFDARRSARGKIYRYQIWNSPIRSVFHARFTWRVARPLDLSAMRDAALPLLGEHDFSSFRAADCPAPHAVRVLRRLEVSCADRPLVLVEAEATAFLKHMVRNLVGTLVEVGLGRRSARSMPELLAARDRTRAGITAPPQGLFLVRVLYP